MRVLDLCTGIGGLTLGYMAHDYQPALFCEQNQYCQTILKARFGDIPIIPNIQDVTAIALSSLRISNIDGIVAGLPCPAFSVAGKQKASQDGRNLFPEFFRIVREVRPKWFVVENVPGLLTAEGGKFFAGVLREITEAGFDTEWGIVSAASVGAVHLRERVFIIAHSQDRAQTQLLGCDHLSQAGTNSAFVGSGDDGNASGNRRKQQLSEANQGREKHIIRNRLLNPTMLESTFCKCNDGFSSGLDRSLLRHEQLDEWLAAATIPRINRLSAAQIAVLSQDEQQAYRECWNQYQVVRKQHKEAIAALGNAVVPQVAIKVFQRLKEILS